MTELSKTYDPKTVEPKWYQHWLEKGFFKADPKSPYHDPAFDPNKTIILYCASGGRSALSGKALKDLGFKDVRNLGAFKDWVESGGAVEK